MLHLVFLHLHASISSLSHRLDEHWPHLGTSLYGFLVAVTSTDSLVKWLGVAGIAVGMACSLSREVRSWRQQYVAERRP